MNSYLAKAILFVWQSSKLWVVFSIILTLIIGCIPFVSLWVTKEVINQISNVFQNNSREYDVLFWLLLFQFMLTILIAISSNFKQYLDLSTEYKIEHEMKRRIYKKITSISIIHFENPEFYNHVDRITEGGVRFLSPIRSFFNVIESAISFVSFCAFLVTVHWSLVVVCILTVFPIFMVHLRFGKKRYNLHVTQTPLQREISYYSYLLKDRQVAKEIRLFGLSTFLINRWSSKFIKNAEESQKLTFKTHVASVGIEGFQAVFYLGIIICMVWLAQIIKMSIGDFIAIGQAIQGTQSSLNRLSESFAKIFEEKLYIEEFFKFEEYHNTLILRNIREKVFPQITVDGIRFENVSFTYTDNSENILDNINLHIKPNEKIAIVGANGSGKTTLIKCLLGLFPVTKGKILIDGVDISEIDPESLNRNMTVIFQDFIRYSLSIRENIGISNVDFINDFERLSKVAGLSGVETFVQSYSKGYETILGKWLADGEELSGGQWQKIALARALFRDSQIIILDEPTAALDPIAEVEIFNKFKLLTQDKLAIFISHRMAASRLADRIIVMKEGKVVEQGTHKELMELKLEYYHMYREQAQWFSENEFTEGREPVEWKS
ncbi:ABC transporter ATP-binding protein [Brevibacillus sp. SYSU BS000544]|uniref:ABC transporter ATP-binding protein n=1 Tax=Brevibacillus sp. SYSU BS000544 TaxID=3416443 RepID=UPI003CE48363